MLQNSTKQSGRERVKKIWKGSCYKIDGIEWPLVVYRSASFKPNSSA